MATHTLTVSSAGQWNTESEEVKVNDTIKIVCGTGLESAKISDKDQLMEQGQEFPLTSVGVTNPAKKKHKYKLKVTEHKPKSGGGAFKANGKPKKDKPGKPPSGDTIIVIVST